MAIRVSGTDQRGRATTINFLSAIASALRHSALRPLTYLPTAT